MNAGIFYFDFFIGKKLLSALCQAEIVVSLPGWFWIREQASPERRSRLCVVMHWCHSRQLDQGWPSNISKANMLTRMHQRKRPRFMESGIAVRQEWYASHQRWNEMSNDFVWVCVCVCVSACLRESSNGCLYTRSNDKQTKDSPSDGTRTESIKEWVSNRVLIVQNTNRWSVSRTAAADPFSSGLHPGSTCYKLPSPSCTIGSVI